jgi:RHS repeat-associated protein
VKVDYASKYKSALNVVKANYESLKVPYYGLDNDDYVNGLGFCCKPTTPTNATTATTATTSPTGKTAANKTDNAELQQYYYHPDHLGSSSYITNLDGEVVQHVEYVPFGEVFLEEKNAVWNTPYLFNAKELDKETGLNYFSARYQDPKTGIFISVDPLAEQTMSSYGYCYNNPVNLIDPTGMSAGPPTDYVDKKGNTILHTNDGSNAVITVPDDKREAFDKSVQGTRDKNLLNSKEWNFTTKNWLVGNWNQFMENNQSWFSTPNARRNATLYWQTGNFENWEAAANEHTGTFRKDLIAWALSISAGILGLAGNTANRINNLGMQGKRLGHTFTKHGIGNTYELMMQAENSGMAQGQWLNNSSAENFIARNLDKLGNGAVTIPIPRGLGRVINPDGSFSPATHAKLVPSGSGVKTAYPLRVP